MSLLNVNERKIKKRLHKTEKAHANYVKAVEELKKIFLKTYDNKTVELLFEVVDDIGHPSEKSRMREFATKYKSENIDEIDIGLFKSLFDNYSDELLEKRNKGGK